MIKKTAQYFHSAALFFKELFVSPAEIGAILPSSKRLGAKMAAQIPFHQDKLVVELGAGTGAITQSLLENNVARKNLIVIERSTALVKHLQKRFPDLTIIEGDAADLGNILKVYNKSVAAIVSSLPLRSLPKEIVMRIEKEAKKVLDKDGVFIQFTYALGKNAAKQLPEFNFLRSHFVWCNIPPARVNVYTANI